MSDIPSTSEVSPQTSIEKPPIIPIEKAPAPSDRLKSWVKAHLPFWKREAQTKPDEIISEIASPPITETLSNPESDVTYRSLKPGEALDGKMPLVADKEDRQRYYARIKDFYPGEINTGKHSAVIVNSETATKIFNNPDSLLSVLEVEFMQRYAEAAGLPKFLGTTINGYQSESIQGTSIQTLINNTLKTNKDASLTNILTKGQGQEIIDGIVKYHKATGRLHGDLTNLGNIIIDQGGQPRLLDTEWERINEVSQTPQAELESMYNYLTNTLGLQGLEKPETITAEQSQVTIQKFKEEIDNMIKSTHPSNTSFKFKNAPQVYISDDGRPMIQSN